MHPQVAASTRFAAPRFAGLRLASLDLGHTGRWLVRQGVPHRTDLDGTIRVAPDQTNGVVLEFGS
jgi:hypothetical protein